MTYILSAFGHTTIAAADGEKGIEAALQQRPSIILCDVQLPRVDGYEVARRLKSNPDLADIPLIAVTALAMVGDRERLLAAGFDGYISKPITPETFVQQVEDYLHPRERLGNLLTDISSPESAENPSSVASRGTVLIINHSDSNLELARTILEPSGFHVVAAREPSSLFSFPDHSLPDLVLYDVHGYEDRGATFLQQAREDERLRSTPVIFLSSTQWRGPAALNQGTSSRVRYLARPIDPEALMSAVNDCCAAK
jgi:two-component system cell cycle response regulator